MNRNMSSSKKKKNTNMSKTSFDDLPQVLVADILSRLPVKSLIRSTCVRKVWSSLIKSPSFISLHLSRSLLDPSNYYIFLLTNYSSEFGLIPDDLHVTSPFPDVFDMFDDGYERGEFEIIGTCKGLVCLKYYRSDIYLINPFIRKYKKLDRKDFGYNVYRDHIGTAFGYSEIENDYKVLMIFRRNSGGHYWFEIYSLKSGEWKVVDFSMDIEIELEISDKATYVQGCLYWCVRKHTTHLIDEVFSNSILLCFSLRDEVFSKIELPETYHTLSMSLYNQITCSKKDSVVLVLYDEPRDGYIRNITLLVMEKNSDGRVQWKVLSYNKCAIFGSEDRFSEDEISDYYEEDYDDSDCESCEGKVRLSPPLGFSVDGKLIFEMAREGKYKYIQDRYVVSINLDNSCTRKEIELGFEDKEPYDGGEHYDVGRVDGITNVLESLVLFSD